MGLLRQMLPLLAVTASCHGAALPEVTNFDVDTAIDIFQQFVANPDPYMEAFGVRAKRHAEDHSGYKEFPLPFLGAELGVKYKDQSDRSKGGEAFIHIDDLQSVIHAAHSKEVRLHIKFDGGAHNNDGLFHAEVDYHLEHKDGDGTEEGSITVVREKKGDNWHTDIKTSAAPFGGETIIPQAISNLELVLESDHKTNFKAKYINPDKDRDLSIDIDRIPGKSITVLTSNHGMKSKFTGTLSKPSSNEIDIVIDGNFRGKTKIHGKISGKMEPGKSTKINVEFSKGSEKVLQLMLEVKIEGSNSKFRGKYTIMGGKVASGKVSGKYADGHFEVEVGKYKLKVNLQLGKSIEVTAMTDGVTMWTYKTLRSTQDDANVFQFDAHSEMTLNPASKLYGFIQKNYPFGAFEHRENTFKFFIDKQHRNTIFRKFLLDFCVVKDGVHVLDIKADTTHSPYKFLFKAPNLLHKLGSDKEEIHVNVNHDKGHSLSIDSNIGNGVTLDIDHTPNSLGGRVINVLATKGGVEMFKYHGITSKTNNDAIFKVGLKGEFNLNQESLLYKKIVSQYKILTPFAQRSSDLEFFWDKHNKNVLLNKWYAKAKIDKDGHNVLNLDISTNQVPYKFYVFLPAVLGKLRPGMTEVDVTVEHQRGQLLEMKVNHAGAKWHGFKIAKTGSGSHRSIEWNGKQLGSGDYSLTDHKFTTTQTLNNGKALTTTITWKNKWDTEAFFLDNKVNVHLDGTERQLNLDLNWGMSKIPDMDFDTPESGHLKLTAVGHNARWGDYSINRDVSWSSANHQLTGHLSGDANFNNGPLAARSPIHTQIELTYDVDHTDLVGKVKKVFAGKEYSIEFPKGSFVMPSIKIGA